MKDGTSTNLNVSRLETEDIYRSLEDEKEEGAPTWGMAASLALLNQYTAVSVVPLRRPDNMNISEEEASAQKKDQVKKLIEKCIARVQAFFPSHALRCLPPSFRDMDTSFFGCRGDKEDRRQTVEATSNNSDGEEGKKAATDPLDECLDLLSVSPGKVTSRARSEYQYGLSVTSSSDTVCRVHPLFLEQLIEEALRALTASANSPAATPSLYSEVVSCVFDNFLSGTTIVEAKCCPPTERNCSHRSDSDSTITEATRLALVFDSRVRPGSVEMPPCAASVLLSRHNNADLSGNRNNGREDIFTSHMITLQYILKLEEVSGRVSGNDVYGSCVACLRPLEWNFTSSGGACKLPFDFDISKVPHALYLWLEQQAIRERAASHSSQNENFGDKVARIIISEGLIVTMQLASKDGKSSADVDFLISNLKTDSTEGFLSIDCPEDGRDSFNQTAIDFAHSTQVVPGLQTIYPAPPIYSLRTAFASHPCCTSLMRGLNSREIECLG